MMVTNYLTNSNHIHTCISDATVHTVVYTHILDISYLKHQVESKRKDNQASSIMSRCFWCHMLLVFVLLKMLPLLYLLF